MTTPVHLYHFTNTGRLLWILSVGELRPGANAVGDYPHPEFVWATTDGRGSRSSAASQGYREGMCLLVRFTLDATDFIPWSDVPSLYPTWTRDAVERLERTGRQKFHDDPALWWCRATPLTLSHAVVIETKAYRDPNWTLLPAQPKIYEENGTLGIVIGRTLFCSTQFENSDGRTAYQIGIYPAPEKKP